MNILTASAEDIKRGQAFKVAANKKKEKKEKQKKYLLLHCLELMADDRIWREWRKR